RKHPLKCVWSTASLQMRQHNGAGFFSCPGLDFRLQVHCNSAETWRMLLITLVQVDQLMTDFQRAFSDDNNTKIGACNIAIAYLVNYSVQGERNLRDQNDISAARDSGVQRDPSGMPSHHLQYHHTI